MILIAFIESPPNAKKLSSLPIGISPNSDLQISAISFSLSPLGGVTEVELKSILGLGSAFLSTLPANLPKLRLETLARTIEPKLGQWNLGLSSFSHSPCAFQLVVRNPKMAELTR